MASRRAMAVAVGYGLSAHPSQSQKAVSGTRIFRGQVLGTNTLGGTKGTASQVTGYLQVLGPVADTNTIVGVAEDSMAAATTDSNTYVRYTPALPHIVFEGSFDNGSATTVLQDTCVMCTFGITQDAANNLWYIDSNKPYAASPAVRIVELVDPAGTVGAGRVRFTFIPGATQFGSSA